ncbi:MAG: protein kinase [Caldisericia bacterium]
MKNLGNYEVVSKIGVGGAGVVYKAKHVETGKIVAIKTFSPPDGIKRESLEKLGNRFTQEINFLKSFNHENIVKYIDGINVGDDRFFVMEYIDNISPKLGERWSIDLVVDVVIQIARALDYAHDKGIVHRDIKPENILVGGSIEKPESKLTDFGIAFKKENMSRMTVAGEIIGTFFYMSPEQIESRECTQRTDIYALGLVAYEFLTGKRVHDGNTPAKVIGQIMLSSPPPPSFFRPEIPDCLDRLILRCIRKDEDARFQSAKELLYELETLKAIGYDGSQTRQISFTTQFSPLVGRDKELSQLTHLLAEVRDRSSRYAYLVGPTGIGKTRLAGELTSVARSWGVKYVSVSVTRTESKNPFGIIAKIAENLIAEKIPDEKWVRVGLASLSTSLAKKLGTAPPNLNSKELFHLIEDAIICLFRDRCKNSTILVTVDDSQWSDSGSAMIAEKIINYVDDISLCVVFTINTDMASPGSAAFKMIEKTKSRCDIIRLQQLSNLDVKKYIQNTLAVREIPESLLDFICKEAGGNPLYIAELLRSVIKKGSVKRDSGILKVEKGELSVPDKLLKYQNLAFSNLDERTGNLITVAAVIGPTFSARLLSEVSGYKIFDVHSHLDRALTNQVLRVMMTPNGNVYSFSHEQMRINLINSTSLHFRQGVSQKTAQAIESLYSSQIENYIERLIYHYLHGLTPTSAIPYLLMAGRFSADRFYHKEASIHANRALHLAEENGLNEYIVLSMELLADISQNLGKSKDALEEIEKALEYSKHVVDLKADDKARLLRKYASHRKTATGEITESINLIEKALDMLSNSENLDEIARSELTYASLIRDPNDALKHIDKSLRIFEQVDNNSMLVNCYGTKANLLRKMNKIGETVEVLEKARSIGEENGLESSLEGIYATLASVMFNKISDVTKGKMYAMKARKLARRTENLGLVGFMNYVEAFQLYQFGILDESEKLLVESLEIWEKLGQKPRLFSTMALLAWVYLELGNLEKGFEFLIKSKELHNRSNPNDVDMDLVSLEIELLKASKEKKEAIALAQQNLKNLDNQTVVSKINFYYALASLYIDSDDIINAWKYMKKSRDLLGDQKMLYMDFVTLISYAKILTQIMQRCENVNYLSKMLMLAGTGLIGKDLLSLTKSVYEDAFISALNGGNKFHVVKYYLEHSRFLRESLKYRDNDVDGVIEHISSELMIADELVKELYHPKIESEIYDEIRKIDN